MTKREIKSLLEKYYLKPKKYMGQNFLVNDKILDNIAISLKIKSDDRIIEIGPGLGNLTKFILEKNPKIIIAIEKDDEFCKILGKELSKYIEQKKLSVINEDILKVNFENLISCLNHFSRGRAENDVSKIINRAAETKKKIVCTNYKIVGNIPYYLTSNLIRKIFESSFLPEKIILTIQKEVAQRICAKPPEMNLLALSVQIFAEPKIISYIKKQNFWPEPKVDSATVEISPRKKEEIALHAAQIDTFFKIIKAAFAGKRKQLINTLSKLPNLDKNRLKIALDSVKIDEKARPETIPIEKWIKLVSSFEQIVIK